MLDDAEVRFEEIPAEECRELLARQAVGRVAVIADGRPLIFPVNYRFENGSVVFRTDPGTKLASAPLRPVAFEIDEVDLNRGTGWSVLVQGHAWEITGAIDARSSQLLSLPVAPLAPGERSHWLQIEADDITGRRIRRESR